MAKQADEEDHPTITSLLKATYGILFFATPHKGLMIDDIQSMIAEDHARNNLFQQITSKSGLLINQKDDFTNLIRDRKIVSFFETEQTRRLEWVRRRLGERGIHAYVYCRTPKIKYGDELGAISLPLIPIRPFCSCQVTWNHGSL